MTSPRNVLVIVVDTARADDAFSTDPECMPALHRIAEAGTRYTRAFASAPWTLPSHAGLFTGCYSSKHGAHGAHPYLEPTNETLADAFADAGYETWAVSNNTWISGEFGFDQGFETFWRGWQLIQSTHDVGSILHESGRSRRTRAAVRDILRGNTLVNAINASYTQFHRSRGRYGGRRTTDRAERWLRDRDSDRPFFGFINYLEPHIEYAPPRAYAEQFLPQGTTYEEARGIRQDPRAFDVGEYDLTVRERVMLRALYRGELAFVDAQLDHLRGVLQATGDWEETILVILGDHGENIGDHGFLGHQYNVYDTLLHVPLVLAGGPFDGRGETDDLVQLIDIAPTLLDAVDIPAPSLREQCQGESFHPHCRGARRHVIAEYLAPQPPVATLRDRFGDLPPSVTEYDRVLRTIRTNREKLIQGDDGHCEYYRVDRDPGEQDERSTAAPDRVETLRAQLASWQEGFDTADRSGDVDIAETTKDQLAQLGYM